MVWKTRKFGVNNGRTIRSKHGRSRSIAKRSEGLLIQTLSEGKQDEEQSVTYSLGKQNRWLLPEVIKTNSVKFKDEESEDVILVERYANEGNKKGDRPDCFSVFNSTDGTTRECKRRLARVRDLVSPTTDSTKTRYEITYPRPSGSWHYDRKWNTGGHTAHFDIRKKSSLNKRTIEEDFKEVSLPESYYQDCEDGVSDFTDLTGESHSSNMDRSLTFDLGLFACSSLKKTKKSLKKKPLPSQTDSGEDKKNKVRKGEAIYIDSDDAMHDAHKEFLAQIHETSLDMIDWEGKETDLDWSPGPEQFDMTDWGGEEGDWAPGPDQQLDMIEQEAEGGDWPPGPDQQLDMIQQEAEGGGWPAEPGQGRGRGRGRGRVRVWGRGYRRNYKTYHFEEAQLSSGLSSAPAVPNPSNEQWSFLLLSHQEIIAASLEEKWGKKYVEGACFPRAFALSATPESCESSGEEVFVLFQLVEDYSEYGPSQVKARVSTVVVCSHQNVHELVSRKFFSWIRVNNAEKDTWTLEDVVNIATSCFKSAVVNKGVNIKQPRKPTLVLNVFMELFGWKSETFPLEMAQQEVKKTLEERIRQAASEKPLAIMTTVDHHQQTECGICFASFSSEDSDAVCFHTSLSACGHKFCDDCWRAHLKTQIQLGHTDLKCPGHDCTTAVDEVTLMSLVPSWYCRHFIKRLNTILEISPEWKWCPVDQCKLVVKATASHDLSMCHNRHVDLVQPVPVVCVCGTMWCFKCQEDAHWPATCEAARIFRQKNKHYAEIVERDQRRSLIKSVLVKNCPFCHYPIEKGLGCPHMHCGLCDNQFCWDCLGKWDCTHFCKTKVARRSVELPANTKHLRTYTHFAVTSRMARSCSVIRSIHKKLHKLDEGVQIYEKLLPKEERGLHCGTKKHWNHLYKRNIVQDVRESLSFKFQALLAEEGLAIILSFRKESPNNRLVLAFERLLFILERMEDLLKDLNKGYQKQTLERLKHLVKCGKDCFVIISRIKK